jgi:hypothetical protein
MHETYKWSKFMKHSRFYQTIKIKATKKSEIQVGKKSLKINFPEATGLN